jgi:hypothetical protein
MNCILLGTFVRGYVECKNMYGVNNIKDTSLMSLSVGLYVSGSPLQYLQMNWQ